MSAVGICPSRASRERCSFAGGGFGPPEAYATPDIPRALVIADVDADGRLDLAVRHTAWEATGIYYQNPVRSLRPEDARRIRLAELERPRVARRDRHRLQWDARHRGGQRRRRRCRGRLEHGRSRRGSRWRRPPASSTKTYPWSCSGPRPRQPRILHVDLLQAESARQTVPRSRGTPRRHSAAERCAGSEDEERTGARSSSEDHRTRRRGTLAASPWTGDRRQSSDDPSRMTSALLPRPARVPGPAAAGRRARHRRRPRRRPPGGGRDPPARDRRRRARAALHQRRRRGLPARHQPLRHAARAPSWPSAAGRSSFVRRVAELAQTLLPPPAAQAVGRARRRCASSCASGTRAAPLAVP